MAVLLSYVPLLLAGIYGAVRTARRGWAYVLCWLPAVYFSLLHMIFVGSLRYREPPMLGLIVLAAAVLAGSLSVIAPRGETILEGRQGCSPAAEPLC